MSWFGGAEKLLSKINEIHEKFIEAQTELRMLREQTNRTLDEFRAALRHIEARLDSTHRDDAILHAELKAEIRGVELRLNALSEQALHAAIERVARDRIGELRVDPAMARASLPETDE